jgi:hypothetical protein
LGVLQHAVSIPGGAAPEPAFGDYQKTTPVSRLEPRDVLTAGLDAGVSFGLITIAGAGACWYLEWPLVLAPAGGLAIAIWRYFDGLALARGLLEIVETITGKDIDHNGKVGKPEPPHTVRVELGETNQGYRRWQYADFAIEPALLVKLAQVVLSGESFSERTATDIGLTQKDFAGLRDEFIARGLAKWNHPERRQQGVSLTRGGLLALQVIVDTPLPDDATAQNNVPGSTQQHAARNDAGNYAFIGGAK